MTCVRCAQWPSGIGSIRAAYAFGGVIRESIHRFKYQGEFARADALADLMVESIFRPEFVDSPRWDSIAFVPLHRRRRRQRGFDQAERLARHLAEELDLPRSHGLVRVLDTPSQVGRHEAERLTNVRGAFGWIGDPLDGTTMLLVDDVITTGATMAAAAEALLAVGAHRVDGIALARELLK